MSTLYANTNVVPITDNDCILSAEPKIRSSLWRNGDKGYLMSFSSWCPHCVGKVPMWTKLADEINTNPDTTFIIMASDIEKDSPLLAREADITGIPTLFFVEGDGSMSKISTNWTPADLKKRVTAPNPTSTATKASKAAQTPSKSSKPTKKYPVTPAKKPVTVKKTTPKKKASTRIASQAGGYYYPSDYSWEDGDWDY